MSNKKLYPALKQYDVWPDGGYYTVEREEAADGEFFLAEDVHNALKVLEDQIKTLKLQLKEAKQ